MFEDREDDKVDVGGYMGGAVGAKSCVEVWLCDGSPLGRREIHTVATI